MIGLRVRYPIGTPPSLQSPLVLNHEWSEDSKTTAVVAVQKPQGIPAGSSYAEFLLVLLCGTVRRGFGSLDPMHRFDRRQRFDTASRQSREANW